jgi:hypothetical protein
LGSRSRKISSTKPVSAKLERSYLKNKYKPRTGGVTQVENRCLAFLEALNIISTTTKRGRKRKRGRKTAKLNTKRSTKKTNPAIQKQKMASCYIYLKRYLESLIFGRQLNME